MKMKFIFFLLLTSSLFSSIILKASNAEDKFSSDAHGIADEDKTVRGTITDQSGEGLPGVTVAIDGTTKGVLSDINGYYIIEALPGETLSFSYVGFKNQKIVLTKSKSLNIMMQDDIHELEEAIVVGMGTQRKASVIGSISTVSVSSLNVSQSSLTSNLSGRIAGTIAVQRSGEPGQDAAAFWIRGLSTFGSNQSPLMLIDGVERNINDISVDEIESISILKDASATAVYGVRAANGVVVITTRKGVAQKPSVEVKFEYGVSDLPRMPEYLDGPNYARLVNEAVSYSNPTKKPYSDKSIYLMTNPTEWYHPYTNPNVNWFDEVFKKWSNNFTASVNINGGGERARYYVTAGYLTNNGNLRDMKGEEYKSNPKVERYNFRSNIDLTLTKTTILNLEIGANLIDMHQPGIGNRTLYGKYMSPAEEVFHWANLVTPTSNPVRVPLGLNGSGQQTWGWGAPTQVGEFNPAERLFNSGYTRSYNTQAMTQAVLSQKLNFLLDGLTAVGSFSFDYYNSTRQNYKREPQTYTVDKYNQAEDRLDLKVVTQNAQNLAFNSYLTSNRAIETKFQLIYDQIFNKVHRVGGMFMYYQRNYVDGGAGNSIYSLPYRKQGIAARATYSYGDRYFAEFNIGYNGSENFPKSNRFGIFPAGAVGYLISNESFWKFEPINVLKIRGSLGLVGNESLASVGGQTLRFGYMDLYGGGLGGYNWGADLDAGMRGGVGISQIGVTNLTWEKGLKKNIGLEVKMLNSKISLDLDFFHETRRDILITRQTIPGFAGFDGLNVNANKGKVASKGFDGTLEVNQQIDNVHMRFYGNFTYSTNEIKEMDEAQRKYAYSMKTGHRINQQFGLIAVGLFKDQDDIANSPSQASLGQVRPGDVKYLDYNKDGIVDRDDMNAIGYSSIPEIVYGFGTQFTWKNFDFGVFFRGQDRVSYSLGNAFIPFSQGVGKGNVFKEAMNRWTPENPDQNAFYPRLSDGIVSNNWEPSTRNIYNGRLLRLADLEFGYTFDKKKISVLGVQNLRVYFLGNNLALISKWKMWDPETGSSDGSKYPNTRKFNFGLRAKF